MDNENQIIVVRTTEQDPLKRKVQCTVIRHVTNKAADRILESYEDCVAKSIYTHYCEEGEEIRLTLQDFGHD